MIFLNSAIEICEIQNELGGSFVFEHPWGASSWIQDKVTKLLSKPGMWLARGDQCMFGLRDQNQEIMQKRTGFLTNNETVFKALNISCIKDHEHRHVLSGRSKQAAEYPDLLVDSILRAYKQSLGAKLQGDTLEKYSPCSLRSAIDSQWVDSGNNEEWLGLVDFNNPRYVCSRTAVLSPDESEDFQAERIMSLYPTVLAMSDDEVPADEEGARGLNRENEKPDENNEPTDEAEPDPSRRKNLIYEISKAHRGLGHPDKPRFLKILKAAGASDLVIRLARQYNCLQCAASTRPKAWRRAAPPRELETNEVVGVDTITLKHGGNGEKIDCLNIVCWGSRVFNWSFP